MEFLIAFWVPVLFVSGLNLIRMNQFSKFMRAEISRVCTARLSGNYDVQWPNVQASYDNLKWYDLFNYNFHSLIVYDKS